MNKKFWKGRAHIHLTLDFYTRAKNAVNAESQIDDEVYEWVRYATGESPVHFDWTFELEQVDG